MQIHHFYTNLSQSWIDGERKQLLPAVSRAFGDRLLKRYVVADPDILEEELSSDDHLLILATDGLWDVVSNQDAIMMVRVRRTDPSEHPTNTEPDSAPSSGGGSRVQPGDQCIRD